MSLLRFTQPLIAWKELPISKPIQVQVGDERITLLRQGDQIRGFPERCPHRGTSLIHGTAEGLGVLRCPYHGWRTQADGRVRNAEGNELKHCEFQGYPLRVEFGYVWLDRGAPVPVSGGDELDFCGAQGFLLSAPFHVVLDNFNEGSHTPFIHGLTGPEPEQLPKVQFDWSDEEDHVRIHYQGPQRANVAFHGWRALLPARFRRRMIWDISWRTYFDPVYMRYDSTWFWEDEPGHILLRVRHFYFVSPFGPDRTRFHSFAFAGFPTTPRILHPLYRMASLAMTRNQVMEDERFYRRIRDLPRSFDGMHFDRYDLPVVRIRKRAEAEYLGASPEA